LSCVATGLLLSACSTTGDPRQGGLFGWSEAKARERQEERQERVAREEAALGREDARSTQLEKVNAGVDTGLAGASREHQRAEARLRAQQATTLAKVDRLETESPTPASASRARSYRRKVNTIVAQTGWKLEQRREALREIELEIDSALDRLKR
jgi:hypothetical protein